MRAREGLLLIQGPLALNYRAPHYPRVENASLTSSNWGRPDRIRTWLDCHVHVRGRPEWLFIKLHTHGAIESDFDALFGEKALAMHERLATELNDGRRYQLHYVTARQAYNVIKAAEAGCDGNPADFYDFSVGRQATSYYCLDASHQLECCTAEKLVVRDIAPHKSATLRLRTPRVNVAGPLRACTVDQRARVLRLELHPTSSPVPLEWEGSEPAAIDGGVLSASPGRLVPEPGSSVQLRY
jgi:hypothetical protein